MPGPNPRILRYRVDAPAALVVCLAASIMVAGAAGVAPWWCFPPLFLALRWGGIVQHNHSHLPLFRGRVANVAFDSVLTFVSAVPQPIYRHIHIEVHHRYLNSPADWTGPFSSPGTSFPDRPIPFWHYCLSATPPRLATRRPRHLAHPEPPGRARDVLPPGGCGGGGAGGPVTRSHCRLHPGAVGGNGLFLARLQLATARGLHLRVGGHVSQHESRVLQPPGGIQHRLPLDPPRPAGRPLDQTPRDSLQGVGGFSASGPDSMGADGPRTARRQTRERHRESGRGKPRRQQGHRPEGDPKGRSSRGLKDDRLLWGGGDGGQACAGRPATRTPAAPRAPPGCDPLAWRRRAPRRARRRSASGPSSGPSHVLTPRLADTWSEPATDCSALFSRVAAINPASSSVSCSNMTNSSPPRRPTTSVPRAAWPKTLPSSWSARSPEWCPRESLRILRLSTSATTRLKVECWRRARFASCSSRSSKAPRLRHPVNASTLAASISCPIRRSRLIAAAAVITPAMIMASAKNAVVDQLR